MDKIDDLRRELYELDVMNVDDFQAMRNKRFGELILHHYRNSPVYRELLKESGIKDERSLPRSVLDIGQLPVTNREWFEKVRVHENPSVPKENIRKNIETSGSTGNVLFIPYSDKASLKLAGELFARGTIMSDVDPRQPAYIVMHWIPGEKDVWGAHECALRYIDVGGNAIDESTQTSFPKHLQNMIESGVEYALSGPPFFSALVTAVSVDKDLKNKLKLKRIIGGGGGVLDQDHDFIVKTLGLDGYTLMYATSEAMIIGTQIEGKGPYCTFSDGHIVEIVDDNFNPIKEGEKGKILVTPLHMDSTPVIRYEQGDEARYLGERPFEGYSKFVPIFDSIRRFNDASIGSGLLPYSEIEKMPVSMSKKGVIVRGIQIAKQRKDMKDLPVIRLEVPPDQDEKRMEESAIDIFKQNDQMNYLIRSGEIHTPQVEIYGVGELRGKNMKLKLYVDETV